MLDGKEITIPPLTYVIPNINAVHTYPRYWGSDPLTWNPKRWMLPEGSSSDANGTRNTGGSKNETLLTPPKGSFVPWSDGARGCPGKKFGQVEFVAAMCFLFREHKVAPVLEGGESMEAARQRTLEGVWNSGMVFLLQMMKPERIALRWEKVR